MGVDPVDYEEAQRHGLVIPEATVDDMDGESLNASLEASIAKMDGDLRGICRGSGGLRGGGGRPRLLHRPQRHTPGALERGRACDLRAAPSRHPDTQARAMVKFVEDQRKFDRAQRGVQDYATQEEWDALYDAVNRIKPTDVRESGTLYRGMSIDPNNADQFLAAIKRDGYQALPTKMVDSWSRTEETAQRFAGSGKSGNERIILVNEDYRPATASTPSSALSRSRGVLSTSPTSIPIPTRARSCSCSRSATESTRSSGGGTVRPPTSMSASSNNRSTLTPEMAVLAAVVIAAAFRRSGRLPALGAGSAFPVGRLRSDSGGCSIARSGQLLEPPAQVAVADLAVHPTHVPLMPQPLTDVNS